MKIAIIGAGLTGATLAIELANKGHQILVVEREGTAGGHVLDEMSGNTPVSKFGPHIFHTDDEQVMQFVLRFTSMKTIIHRVRSYTKFGWLPWPINMETIEKIYNLSGQHALNALEKDRQVEIADTTRPDSFEARALKQMGRPLYDTMLRDYTLKQWGRHPSFVPGEVMGRVRIKTGYNEDFFSDKYVAEPVGGYTNMVAAMLNHQNIHVEYGILAGTKILTTLLLSYDKVISTAPPDVITNSKFGKLDYLSVNFGKVDTTDPRSAMIVNSWPTAVVNFPTTDVPFTRGTAYHRLNNTTTPEYVIEMPGSGEELYPVRTEAQLALHKKYRQWLDECGVVSAGRLGSFEYIDMHIAIRKALDLAAQF